MPKYAKSVKFGPRRGRELQLKTTLNIDDTVFQKLSEEALRRGTTMSALGEAGLRHILNEGADADPVPRPISPLQTWHGGKMLGRVHTT